MKLLYLRQILKKTKVINICNKKEKKFLAGVLTIYIFEENAFKRENKNKITYELNELEYPE